MDSLQISSFFKNLENGGFNMKYGIAIFPSKHIQDEANALRKRYDPRYDLIPPHITLKSAFKADDALRDEIIRELEIIAERTKPFTIYMNKVRTFAPVTNTIYFKVEPTPELTKLHEQMHSGIFPQDKEYNFVPHITIAQQLAEDEFSDVLGTLSMKKIEFEDTVDRFQLCYQLENGSWTVYETFIFGSDD